MRLVILGATGMLGSMLVDYFARHSDFELVATVRTVEQATAGRHRFPGVQWACVDAGRITHAELEALLSGATAALNAIGLIKQRIRDDNPAHVDAAVRVNALFSIVLAQAARSTNVRCLQVATDCVYSGAIGNYQEPAPHDCLDVYGKSKSLGEVAADGVANLRCSIIGTEVTNGLSLLNWFLTQPEGACINGFTNHMWNGITTLHFAKICRAIVEQVLPLRTLQHIVPGDMVSKYVLLRQFAAEFDRMDVVIKPVVATVEINRTLATTRPDMNAKIWAAAGYARPPAIDLMVHELAEYVGAGRREE